jgi:hypothetical protein
MERKRTFRSLASRLGACILAAAALLSQPTPARAAAGNTNLKIYEVAGAGGLSGASYRQDTIILFNPTAAAISCTTCAIQTHSGTSNTASWTVYQLPALNIPAGGYYMISASSVSLATYGSVAPIPYDYELQTIEDGGASKIPTTQNILSSTVGVVALTNSFTALTAGSASQCGTGSNLLDFVGYGSDIATNSATSATPSSCYAGSGEAYYDGSSQFGRQLGVIRQNVCTDTFNNATDWSNVPPIFLNSSSARTPCSTGTQLSAVVTSTPTNPGVGESVTFTAAVTKATSPASTGLTAYLDLNSPYFAAAALQMYDDGTHGDKVAGDGTYTLTTTVPTSASSGFTYPTNVTITDAQGDSFLGETRLTVSTGTIGMTTPSTTGSVKAGGVLTFPITLTGQHGYGGILNVTCTGTPNANSLGVPVATQCVSTPPEVTLASDGNTTISLAIATGTTSMVAANETHRSVWFAGAFGLGLLGVGLRRRKRLPMLLVALLSVAMISATGCGTNAGLSGTTAAPGTYIYTVTATDSNLSTVTNSLNFTITVQ